ncbi:hypothetical protein [Vagococcus xieshaowenii]|uniref:Uncharacterized protein n=1 Tax=Vagococcus xieshaowenii TaxID=2562451 RepID=A0AAJ5EFJ8_9ENTE|nr:hypothetical protein [Vagococcus xieshaowenii]TFZ42932.1 hypothetical protein E4031_01475 [Vagococcus xieshaowenii]
MTQSKIAVTFNSDKISDNEIMAFMKREKELTRVPLATQLKNAMRFYMENKDSISNEHHKEELTEEVYLVSSEEKSEKSEASVGDAHSLDDSEKDKPMLNGFVGFKGISSDQL